MAARLRSGFTTGACSAAAAKAAAAALVCRNCPKEVELTFPDGSTYSFDIHRCSIDGCSATASVIKDAGDDPDVTNHAEIVATVSSAEPEKIAPADCVAIGNVLLCRGEGVGTVTKPGLAVDVGEPAINPVPRQMIVEAVGEVAGDKKITVTLSIPRGRELAERTLNKRLGILDGLSILGTTGIVRPVSADAWTATIQASLDVAKHAGLREVVLSTGRTSEKGVQDYLGLPEECFAMMGDYLEFSLSEAAQRNFTTIHIGTMWAKTMKAAMRIPQTHVRHGALEVTDGVKLLVSLGAGDKLADRLKISNTAREIYTHLEGAGRMDLVRAVCLKAREYCQDVAGCTIKIYLVNHKAEIITHV
ncbi:MAG: cobalt-precorrin-5B (C(1))-methyltransferase CbiD [Desulforhopalus sp.]